DYLRDHPTEPITLTVSRNGRELPVPFDPGNPKVDTVTQDGPAAHAGLQPGDLITAIDGQPARSTLAISDYISGHTNHAITLSILRKGQPLQVRVTPEIPQGDTVARIGIVWADPFGITLDQYGNMIVKHPGPVEQIRASMLSIFNTVGAIASPKS